MQNESEYEEGLTPAEREVAVALGGLRPAPAGLDRDRLMFQAGRASTRRTRHLWRAVAAVLAACLCLSIAFRPPPRETVRIVRVAAPPSQAPAHPTVRESSTPWPVRPDSYIRMRSAVLERGLCALPEAAAPGNGNDALWPAELLDIRRRRAPEPSGLLEWLDI